MPKTTTPPSPAKPTMTKPLGHRQAFFYHPKDLAGKTDAYTPEKTHVLPIRKRKGGTVTKEGPVHCYLKSPTSGFIASGDSPLKQPHAKNYDGEKLQLLAQLYNLKTRADGDIRSFEAGTLNIGHFEATRIKINEFTIQYNKVSKLAPDPSALISELNEYISDGRLYNPFGLEQIYNPFTGYDYKKATDLAFLQSLFELPEASPTPSKKPRARSLFEDFKENEPLTPSEASIVEEDSHLGLSRLV